MMHAVASVTKNLEIELRIFIENGAVVELVYFKAAGCSRTADTFCHVLEKLLGVLPCMHLILDICDIRVNSYPSKGNS